MKHKIILALLLTVVLCTVIGVSIGNADTIYHQITNGENGGIFVQMIHGQDQTQPFNIAGTCVLFPTDQTRKDCTLNIGYNNAGGGGTMYNGKTEGFYTQWESHYATNLQPAGQYEYHLNAFGDGWNTRPFQIDVRKDSGYTSTKWRGDSFGFATRQEAGMLGFNEERTRIYNDLYAQKSFAVGGVWGDSLKIRDGKIGFNNVAPISKPTCNTLEDCVIAIEALGLINYTGND